MRKKTKSFLTGYGLALGLLVLTLLIIIVLRYYAVTTNLSLLTLGAIGVCAWYGGRGPALLLGALFQAIAIAYSPQRGFSFGFILYQLNTTALLIGLVMLVSGRRKGEKKLREQRKWLQTTLASIGDGVIATDGNGRIVFMNAAAQRMTGWSEVEATGNDLGSIFRISDVKSAELAELSIDIVLQDSETAEAVSNTVLVGRDGRKTAIDYSVAPIKDEKASILGVVLVFHDISVRQAAEQEIRRLNEELENRVIERTAQLEAANRELESFSYSVSHDLRAPLRSINGFARILSEDFSSQLPAEAYNYLQSVQRNAQRMGQLVDDLLAFSRLGRQTVTKRRVDLDHLAHEVMADLRSEQPEREVEIVFGELPACNGDPSLLKQIFVNLFGNALKYTRRREAPRIEIGYITVADETGAGAYYVKDNGVGFDMQYSGKLFGVFQRLHRMEDYEGTGLGLAIVQRIVNRHGGRIWAEAEVDKGAVFYFTLPVA